MMPINKIAPGLMATTLLVSVMAPSSAFLLPEAATATTSDMRPNNHPCFHKTSSPFQLSSSSSLSMHHSEDFDREIVGDDAGGVVIEDLAWRVEQLRLEEQNKQRFLKAKARFLPYNECRKWVQAWGQRWETAEDWQDWIAMGEKRNPYIPSAPDEYYGRLGQWVSWDHFLLEAPEEEEDLNGEEKDSGKDMS